MAILTSFAYAQEIVRVGGDAVVVTNHPAYYLMVNCHVYRLVASDDQELRRREIGERYTDAVNAAETEYKGKEKGIEGLKDSDPEAYQASHDAHQAKYEEACRVAAQERDDALARIYQPCDELLPNFTDIVIGIDEPFRVFYFEGVVDDDGWCLTFWEPWRFYRGPRWCYDWGYHERIRYDRIRNFRRDYSRHAYNSVFGWRDRNDRRPQIRSAFHVGNNERPHLPDRKIERRTGRDSWFRPDDNRGRDNGHSGNFDNNRGGHDGYRSAGNDRGHGKGDGGHNNTGSGSGHNNGSGNGSGSGHNTGGNPPNHGNGGSGSGHGNTGSGGSHDSGDGGHTGGHGSGGSGSSGGGHGSSGNSGGSGHGSGGNGGGHSGGHSGGDHGDKGGHGDKGNHDKGGKGK